MSCKLDLNDIVYTQALAGTISTVDGLTEDQMSGVLAALSSSVNQDADEIACAGLGSFGLFLSDLQLTGIIKKGLAASDDPALIPTIVNPDTGILCLADPEAYIAFLSDASIFTGKDGVFSVDDLLSNEALQRTLSNSVITRNMSALEARGALTGDEDYETLAELAGLSAKYPESSIMDKINGFFDDLSAGFEIGMQVLGAFAIFGAVLATVKGLDLLGKLSGWWGAIISLPDEATDTIEQADTNAGVDSIVGSNRIQSEAERSAANTGDSSSSSLSSIASGLL